MNKQITVEFNAGNLIPQYQQKYRLYDRFLPHLAPYLDGTVVDVGANCGVLAVSMGMNNHKLSFICVEPEDQCLELLYKNTEKIDNHVEVIAGKVGTDDIKLDEIVKEGVGLIKVDVDGYDWDVINTFSFSTKRLRWMNAERSLKAIVEPFRPTIRARKTWITRSRTFHSMIG